MDIHKNARTLPISRELLVNRIVRDGMRIEEAAEAAGISVRRAYVWKSRPKDEGYFDRSSRPHHLPEKLKEGEIAEIVELRRKRLTYREIQSQTGRSLAVISQTLKRVKLERLGLLDGPPPPVQRYEWDRPGFLHLDIKALGRILEPGKRMGGRSKRRRAGWEYLHVAIDDYARVAYAEMLPDQTASSAAAFLRRATKWLAKKKVIVHRVMTDNGGCYKSREFLNVCSELDIKHVRTRPYTPKTNGKAERLIQTLCREWAYRLTYNHSTERAEMLHCYLHFYNHHRAHTALGYSPPISRLLNNVPERDT